KCEWWKAKKWAYGILGRLFHRCVFSSSILLASAIHLSSRDRCRRSMAYLHSIS
ncbi:hypothetical protein BDR03DRAFT_975723, partial [Suillus americanus]